MTIYKLYTLIVNALLIVCLYSCGQGEPHLGGKYKCETIIDNDVDSAFIEITEDSNFIFVRYLRYPNSIDKNIEIGITKLKCDNDTMYIFNDLPNDSVCEKVDEYVTQKRMLQIGTVIGCLIIKREYLLDYTNREIKLVDRFDKTTWSKLK